MKISAKKGDITICTVDAIVNAANTSLLGGGGVDGAIHRQGGKAILEECIKIRNSQGGCPTGEAVITTAGELPSQFVIHTVGPVWQNGNNGESDLLRRCYFNALKLAEQHDLRTVAFPNISTGVYGYPKDLAAKTAIDAVREYALSDPSIEEVIFICFDEENFKLYSEILCDS